MLESAQSAGQLYDALAAAAKYAKTAETKTTVSKKACCFDGVIVPGTRIMVYWEGERRWYAGIVATIDLYGKGVLVHYDDGDVCWERLEGIGSAKYAGCADLNTNKLYSKPNFSKWHVCPKAIRGVCTVNTSTCRPQGVRKHYKAPRLQPKDRPCGTPGCKLKLGHTGNNQGEVVLSTKTRTTAATSLESRLFHDVELAARLLVSVVQKYNSTLRHASRHVPL